MFPLLPELFLLETDKHLEIYTFSVSNTNLNLWGTGFWHKWLSCIHFSLPNSTRPVYVQQPSSKSSIYWKLFEDPQVGRPSRPLPS
jgi:hypothetical protein